MGVRKNDHGFEIFCLITRHHCKRNNDNKVAGLNFSGCSAVYHDFAGAGFAFDDVSFKSFAIIDVEDLHFFELDELGCIHEVFVNRNATDVFEIGIGDGGPMYFRFKYFDLHHVDNLLSFGKDSYCCEKIDNQGKPASNALQSFMVLQ